MPLYDYKCTACGTVSEVRHGFDQTHTDPCPSCGGAMARVFSAAPIVFKGSGFYKTDSRKASSTESAPASDAKPAESKPSESKPAEAKSTDSKAADSAA